MPCATGGGHDDGIEPIPRLALRLLRALRPRWGSAASGLRLRSMRSGEVVTTSHKTDSTDPMTRLYTAEEVIATIKAVAQAERARALKAMRRYHSLMKSEVERYG